MNKSKDPKTVRSGIEFKVGSSGRFLEVIFPPVQSKIATLRKLRLLHNGGIERLRPMGFEVSNPDGLHTLSSLYSPGGYFTSTQVVFFLPNKSISTYSGNNLLMVCHAYIT